MIPQAHLTEWFSNAPWLLNIQTEQDLLLSRAIVEIFSDPLLQNSLAFRGGTALHKLFIHPANRYSEDIDLVQISEGPIGPIMEALRKRLIPWLGKPKWKLNEGRATFIFRFESEGVPAIPMRLKVEINTREHFSVLGLQRFPFKVDNSWFSGEAAVSTYTLEELLGTKLRALYQRKKGRDLFDLASALKKLPNLDIPKILECFHRYMSFESKKISRAEFEANLAYKIKDLVFLEDILPLLSETIRSHYNVLEELQHVQDKIISLLPGEPWKGE